MAVQSSGVSGHIGFAVRLATLNAWPTYCAIVYTADLMHLLTLYAYNAADDTQL